MDLNLNLPSPLEPFDTAYFERLGIDVAIKRDDLIADTLSGNKWRKLKYNLHIAKQQAAEPIISFGGAYSNHLYALAFAAKAFNLASLAYVRGEISDPHNPTLSVCRELGMRLEPLTREQYRNKTSDKFIQQLKQTYPKSYIIPEGGSNALAVQGCQELAVEIGPGFDFWLLPSASGGTAAGLIAGQNHTKVLPVAVLKDQSLKQRIIELLPDTTQFCADWQLITQYHQGGYAKFTPAMLPFLQNCRNRTGVGFEPIYSGKALFALYALAEAGFFPKGSRILFIHTGGLQGAQGLIQAGRLPADFFAQNNTCY